MRKPVIMTKSGSVVEHRSRVFARVGFLSPLFVLEVLSHGVGDSYSSNVQSCWHSWRECLSLGRPDVLNNAVALDKSVEAHIPDEGEVSYPDLSRPSLANTPRLFAELPLQPQSDELSPTPASDSVAQSPLLQADHDMIDSPAKSDIFEDNELFSPEMQPQLRFSNGPVDEAKHQPLDEEDKENSSNAS